MNIVGLHVAVNFIRNKGYILHVTVITFYQ